MRASRAAEYLTTKSRSDADWVCAMSMKEEKTVDTELVWHDVPGHEGRLQITVCGKYRSVSRYVRSRGGVRRIPGQRLKTRMNVGYPCLRTCDANGKQVTILTHRVLAQLFIPNPLGKPSINHIDGDKANFSLSNLEWCTQKENMAHAHKIGLMPPSKIGPGEASPAAKLTNSQVSEIKKRLRRGESCKSIADDYPVRTSGIDHIRRGRTWAHVK